MRKTKTVSHHWSYVTGQCIPPPTFAIEIAQNISNPFHPQRSIDVVSLYFAADGIVSEQDGRVRVPTETTNIV